MTIFEGNAHPSTARANKKYVSHSQRSQSVLRMVRVCVFPSVWQHK